MALAVPFAAAVVAAAFLISHLPSFFIFYSFLFLFGCHPISQVPIPCSRAEVSASFGSMEMAFGHWPWMELFSGHWGMEKAGGTGGKLGILLTAGMMDRMMRGKS
jgi:hypothetical protein